jgi:AraC-like DNA-binding protein
MYHKDDYTSFRIAQKESEDLTIYHYGMEECKSGHSYGPALRDHFLIHYILSGSGTFKVDGKCYELYENQGFLICPDVITYYEASKETPWTYTWVGFRGIRAEAFLKSANLDRNNPIFFSSGEVIKKYFEEMKNSHRYKYAYELRLQGILSILLSELIEGAKSNIIPIEGEKDIYIRKALQFIESNYSRNMSIAVLARHIGLNKNYFSTLFREVLGIPPKEYITKYRISKACELLSNQGLTISEVSRSVGYDDPLGFSKIFKQIKGISPKAYREVI